MPQVSKRHLDIKTENRILTLFLSSIVLSQTQKEALSLIEDLLTPTERLMLSKRFSIAFMLLDGYDYDSIVDVLKVSRSTIGRVNWWLQDKGTGVRQVREKIKKDEKLNTLWNEIQDTILDVVSGMRGVNWKRSKQALWHFRQTQKKPF